MYLSIKLYTKLKMIRLFLSAILVSVDARAGQTRPEDVDVYSDAFKHPSEFGAVYRDENNRISARLDPDEAPTFPKNSKKYFDKKQGMEGLINPRDEYLFDENFRFNGSEPVNPPMWFDFPNLQEKNIELDETSRKVGNKKWAPLQPSTVIRHEKLNYENAKTNEVPKDSFFKKKMFALKTDVDEDLGKEPIGNFTTCEEFGRDASFHPQDVVEIDWVPFFVWSRRIFEVALHKFTVPTQKLVRQYKQVYGRYVGNKINWEEPKLLMHSLNEMLLIAADRTGLFHGIIQSELPEYVSDKRVHIPTVLLRLKIMDPYLALMYCNSDEMFATVMAVAGRVPVTDDEKTLEAATIGFRYFGQPVERDLELERQRALSKEWKTKKIDQEKYISLNRDHGLFGFDELKEAARPRVHPDRF